VFVLGIDPGVSHCGYGGVRSQGRQWQAVCAGVLESDPGLALPVRLAGLRRDLAELFEALRPDVVVVERVLFQVNATTAMATGQASGLALAEAAARGCPVVEYSANEVKLAVAGDGAAGKRAVQRAVADQLRLPAPPRPPDAADALALALCHLASLPLRRALAAQGVAP
jgi:crossover junction endodeoxyribonuclease RuvC